MTLIENIESQIISVQSCPLCNHTGSKKLFEKSTPQIPIAAPLLTCLKCHFTYSGKSLTKTGRKIFYEQKYEDGNYQAYEKYQSLKVQNFSRNLSSLMKIGKVSHGRLLDLGCGQGFAMIAAKKLGFDVVGVDVSSKAVEGANSQKMGPAFQSELEEFDSLNLGTFDVITLFDTLDHVSDPKKVLKLASLHLKPGGILYVDVCNVDSIYRKIMGRHYIHLLPFEHLSYFSPTTLKNSLQENGFRILKIGDHPRYITYKFLKMTVETFMPGLGRLFSAFDRFIPSALKNWSVPLPVGLISAIVQKPALAIDDSVQQKKKRAFHQSPPPNLNL